MRWKCNYHQISSIWTQSKHELITLILKLLTLFQLRSQILSSPIKIPSHIHQDFPQWVLDLQGSTNLCPSALTILMALQFSNDSENKKNNSPNNNVGSMMSKHSKRKRSNLRKRSLTMRRINDCLWRFADLTLFQSVYGLILNTRLFASFMQLLCHSSVPFVKPGSRHFDLIKTYVCRLLPMRTLQSLILVRRLFLRICLLLSQPFKHYKPQVQVSFSKFNLPQFERWMVCECFLLFLLEWCNE